MAGIRIGAFDIKEPLPKLREPHALVVLKPWIDVGDVGSLLLSRFEAQLKAQELGRLAQPGQFYDFTRYRPSIYMHEGVRQITVPNTRVNYAFGKGANDFLFLHLLEPHMLGESYSSMVLLLLERLGVRRYCLVGSMYDLVPHTRPLIVTGRGVGKNAQDELERAGISSGDYQGPTTITYLISQQAPELGMETVSLVVHLPQYTQFDEDFMGMLRLMEILCPMYGLTVDEVDVRRGEQQRKHVDSVLEKNQQLKEILQQLEAHSDALAAKKREEEAPKLSPEIEKFLREMDKRFGQN